METSQPQGLGWPDDFLAAFRTRVDHSNLTAREFRMSTSGSTEIMVYSRTHCTATAFSPQAESATDWGAVFLTDANSSEIEASR